MNTTSGKKSRFVYTGSCEASMWGVCDLERKSLKSSYETQPLIYLAGTCDYQGFLSLIQPSIVSNKQNELIKFSTGNWTHVGQHKPKNADYEITSLQCIGTSSGDRLGLLVGRRCGLLQLWDDRFPKAPVIEYLGSDCCSLYSVSSHIVPKPVIDPVFKRTIACPLLVSGHVGLWDLWTGEMLNLCMLKRSSCCPMSNRPPEVFYRSVWYDAAGEKCKGPALLVFDNGENYWYYM